MAMIGNPYGMQSPIGQALQNASRLLLSGPTQEQRDHHAASAEMAKANTAKTMIEMDLLKRKQQGMEMLAPGGSIANAFTGVLPEAPRLDPEMAGPMPAISRDQAVAGAMPQLFSALANMGTPEKVGQAYLSLAANAPGTTDSPIVRALVGAGHMPTENTAVSPAGQQAVYDRNQAGRVAIQDSQNAAALERTNAQIAGHKDRYVVSPSPDGKSFTYEPVAAGLAAPSPRTAQQTPRNYLLPNGAGQGITMDGFTDAQSGQPLPQGATVFTGQVQATDVSGLTRSDRSKLNQHTNDLAHFKGVIADLRGLGENPANFGVTGNIRSFGQDILQNVDAFANAFGYQPDAAKQLIGKALTSSNGQLGYDDQLVKLQTLSDLAAYKAAGALANQSGRDLSNADVKRFRQMMGDPKALLSNKAEFFSRLELIEREVERELGTTQSKLGTTAAPGAPAAAGAPPAVQRWGRDAQGNPVPLGGQ